MTDNPCANGCTAADRVSAELARIRERRAQEDADWRLRKARRDAEHKERQVLIDEFIADCDATSCPPRLYARWLKAWINRGGSITHSYDYNLSGWFTPRTSTRLPVPVAYGAQALTLVIDENDAMVPVTKSAGHCRIYRLGRDGIASIDGDLNWVPSYPNVEDLLL